jgi:hypothetical protein
MRPLVFVFASAAAAYSFAMPAQAAPHAKSKHAWQKPRSHAVHDCVPLNGRYGYYGNPWCDTGSYRPPDLDYRDRHRTYRR